MGLGQGIGFTKILEDKSWTGFNVDFCRAIAAAVLGDSNAIEPVITTRVTRFPILHAGEADVLLNNTTRTISRDTALGFDFAPTIFYGGHGFTAPVDATITTLADLAVRSICTVAGTTTEW